MLSQDIVISIYLFFKLETIQVCWLTFIVIAREGLSVIATVMWLVMSWALAYISSACSRRIVIILGARHIGSMSCHGHLLTSVLTLEDGW